MKAPEEKAAPEGKTKGEPEKKDEPPADGEEVEKEETEEEKKKREIGEINAQMEAIKAAQGKILAKIETVQAKQAEVEQERMNEDKVLDLLDNTEQRKFVKTKADVYANEFLTEKMSYSLSKVTTNEAGEEEAESVSIDPSLVRTLEEEQRAEQEDDEAANDPKKKKGK